MVYLVNGNISKHQCSTSYRLQKMTNSDIEDVSCEVSLPVPQNFWAVCLLAPNTSSLEKL